MWGIQRGDWCHGEQEGAWFSRSHVLILTRVQSILAVRWLLLHSKYIYFHVCNLIFTNILWTFHFSFLFLIDRLLIDLRANIFSWSCAHTLCILTWRCNTGMDACTHTNTNTHRAIIGGPSFTSYHLRRLHSEDSTLVSLCLYSMKV